MEDGRFVEHYPPIARTSRYEFWNSHYGRGLVVIRRSDIAACEVGPVAAVLIRWAVRRWPEAQLVNALGNRVFAVHGR